MLFTFLGIFYLVFTILFLVGGVWMTKILYFTSGFILISLPAFQSNALQIFNDLAPSVFAPATPYESWLIAGTIGGFALTRDSRMIRMLVVTVTTGAVTSLLLFSFINYSSSSYSSAPLPVSDIYGHLVSSYQDTNRRISVAVKYVLLTLPAVIYALLYAIRRCRLYGLALGTSVLSGYCAILALEFLQVFDEYYFVNFQGFIDVFAKVDHGSVCFLSISPSPLVESPASEDSLVVNSCLLRHIIWSCVAAIGFILQVIIAQCALRELPASCRPKERLPKPLRKVHFLNNDSTSSLLTDTCSKDNQGERFADFLGSNGYFQCAEKCKTKGSEGKQAEVLECDIEAGQGAENSSCQSYVDLSQIPDPISSTLIIGLMYAMFVFCILAVMLSVDWVFSSTIFATIFVVSFSVAFRTVVDALFEVVMYYLVRIFSKVNRQRESPARDYTSQPLPIPKSMKTLMTYCLLSSSKKASEDCFASMYSSFCRNIDPNGQFHAVCVAASNDIDIIKHELELRDLYRAQLVSDLHASYTHVMKMFGSEEGTSSGDLSNDRSCSDDTYLNNGSVDRRDSDSLVSIDHIHRSSIQEMLKDFGHNNDAENLKKWCESIQVTLRYHRMLKVWKFLLMQWKNEFQMEESANDWQKYAKGKAKAFILEQSKSFMYLHRTTRVLRKPGQYQDVMQLATWGKENLFTYAKPEYPQGNTRGKKAFGMDGNVINPDGKYSEKAFAGLVEHLGAKIEEDKERIRKAGAASYGCKDEDSAHCPYSFTLLMDSDTNATEGSVEVLVQLGYHNPLHGIIQPIIVPTGLTVLEESRKQATLFSSVENMLLSAEFSNSTVEERQSSDSTHSLGRKSSGGSSSNGSLQTSSSAEGSVKSKGTVVSNISVPPNSFTNGSWYCWRTKLKDLCVPITGPSRAKILGRSYFYGKGLINNYAYCSLIIGTEEHPKNILPLDVYSHDTFESLFCRPTVTDAVYFTEDPPTSPLEQGAQQTRWLTGELINAAYLYPHVFGLLLRSLRAVYKGFSKIKDLVRSADETPKKKFPLVLTSAKDADNDISSKGTHIASYFAKEPLFVIIAPFFIFLALIVQTFFTSTQRPIPNLSDFYHLEGLAFEAMRTAQKNPKYWFFMYFKDFELQTGLLAYMVAVWIAIPFLFKVIEILFFIDYRLESNADDTPGEGKAKVIEKTSMIWRRKGIHIVLVTLELVISIFSFPPQILIASGRLLKSLWFLTSGKLSWKPQREVEHEIQQIILKGKWAVAKASFKHGWFVMLFGLFIPVWLLYLQPELVNDGQSFDLAYGAPIFAVFVVGILSWVVYPFWVWLMTLEMSQHNLLFRWVFELEVVLERIREFNPHTPQ
eukprot:Nk52_evm7s249 gene=Nk52_evmTU7s249